MMQMRETYYAGPLPNAGLLVFTAEDSFAAVAFLVVVRGPAARSILRLSPVEPALIGSAPALNHFALPDDGLGGQQFSVRYQEGAFLLSNLDPTKMPTVNGEAFDRRPLEHHDTIAVGRTELVFCQVAPETLASCVQ